MNIIFNLGKMINQSFLNTSNSILFRLRLWITVLFGLIFGSRCPFLRITAKLCGITDYRESLIAFGIQHEVLNLDRVDSYYIPLFLWLHTRNSWHHCWLAVRYFAEHCQPIHILSERCIHYIIIGRKRLDLRKPVDLFRM